MVDMKKTSTRHRRRSAADDGDSRWQRLAGGVGKGLAEQCQGQVETLDQSFLRAVTRLMAGG